MLALALLAPGVPAADPPAPPTTPGSASDLLRPPGSGSYSDPIPWEDLPPWQRTTFFGVPARGRVFVFVVDCSGSMADDARLARAKAELRRVVAGLRWPQRFLVIFYNDRPRPMPGGLPATSDLATQQRFVAWLRSVEADGETDPRGAMSQALGLRPDAVFLLSDGLFPEGSVEAIARANPRKTPIHCIDLAGGAAGDHLRRIAGDSGGQYAARR